MTCNIAPGSPPSGLYTAVPVDVTVSHECTVSSAPCTDQGMVLSSVSELNLVEMTDVEYTHLQHIIYSQMEAQSVEQEGSGDAKLNSGYPVSSPAAIQTVYLSSDPHSEVEYAAKTPSPAVGHSNTPSSESQYLLHSDQQSDFQEIKMIVMGDPVHLPERTPTMCGEVPGPVLAKVRSAMETSEHGVASETRLNPAARVRLEKRFNCSPCEVSRQQEYLHDQPTLNRFVFFSAFSKLHHQTELFGVAMQPQASKCLKLGRSKPAVLRQVDFPYPVYGRNMCNSIVGVPQAQGIGSISHILESAKHQDLIIPRNFSFSYQQDAESEKTALRDENTQAIESEVWIKMTEGEELRKVMPPARRGRGRRRQTGPPRQALNDIQNTAAGSGRKANLKSEEAGENSQRRERHNIMERDRRRRIRICCDELNMLVPFCNRDTDKATTLQWTTAFLKYIKEIHGDSLKMEFQNTFCGKTGKRIKLAAAGDQFSGQRETVNPSCIALADYK
ncbi:transcription factor-like 5 protein isoform X2 [Conger conger]|uniref:transcription factor-like 5 protein isoform X2 n=1 Tax=Conger conger TaxID=82655 RepID=UPI002A5A6A18|nr:transcription factor-like 5 protein isoform X2 [Conger conger]